MPRIHKVIDIDARPEDVFAYAADVANMPEWTTFVKEVQITSGDGKSAGTTDRSVIKVGLRPRVLEYQWIEYKPGRLFARQAAKEMAVEERIAFSPANDGTRVEWTVSYVPPLGLLGRIANFVFMDRVFQNEIEASLESLKARIES